MKTITASIVTLFMVPALGYLYLIYLYEPDSLTQSYLDEKEPVVKLRILEEIMNRGESDRWSWSDNAAELAFKAGNHAKAEQYALASLSMSKHHKGNWNYGNAIHNSNVILGRIRFARGDIGEARDYLIRASTSTGSPQLDTFGPNLDLANELLKTGERNAVVRYLKAVSKFWEMDNGCVAKWLSEIESGDTPKLCRCSC